MSWQKQLQTSFTKFEDLLKFLELDDQLSIALSQPRFPLQVPRFFASLMKKRDIHDPLLRQVLPTLFEEDQGFGGTEDPLNEIQSMKGISMMQKFHSRVLFITTSRCAINCRYCFRRNFPYDEHTASLTELERQLVEINKQKDIFEVIFSGGDPLILPNRSIAKILECIESLDNIKFVRIHTRLPVVLPDRVDEELLRVFKKFSKKIILVLHINHQREISVNLSEKVRQLNSLHVTVYNQAVLLRGVNDTFEAQKDLWVKSTENQILPYYLHQLDEVKGGNHFLVPKSEGLNLIKQLRESLPGYMVPKYVKEIPGALSKVPLSNVV